ncbi:NAD-dependent epimerase/dehydratase family protein [Pseudonocardia sp. CA-107938]|uniref:NAD-dependent epimerase/dehydratase family protein n=1 Tax=Pseudonocardia sp. CA-107938 TaxID=3240021 RepID=UPI003D89E517
MRVFLAGATGVVGRRLVPRLLAAGHHVTALTRHPDRAPALHAAGAEPVVADVFDLPAISAAVAAAHPDAVVHQLTDLADRDLGANAAIRETGTTNLVEAALAAGARRIVAQSICWAYVDGEPAAREDEPLDLQAPEPRGQTVRAVAALEKAVGQAPEWVVLRYGLFYGPGTWYAPDGAIAAAARSGRLPADRDVKSFVHVDDAAQAAVAALTWPSGPVNVCDDEPAAGHEWVPVFAQVLGAPPPPVTESPRAGWARGADNHHARSDLGWTPAHPTWRRSLGQA